MPFGAIWCPFEGEGVRSAAVAAAYKIPTAVIFTEMLHFVHFVHLLGQLVPFGDILKEKVYEVQL